MLPNPAAEANPVGYELSQHIPVAPAVHERTIVHDLPARQIAPEKKYVEENARGKGKFIRKKVAPREESLHNGISADEPAPPVIPTPAPAGIPSGTQSGFSAPAASLIEILDAQLKDGPGNVIFTGQTGDRYAIEKKLGQGGMGGVFLARRIVPDLELPAAVLPAVADGIARLCSGTPCQGARKLISTLDGWTLASLYRYLFRDNMTRDASLLRGIERAETIARESALNERGCLKVAAQGQVMAQALGKEIAAAGSVTTQFMAPIKAVTCHKVTGAMGVFYSFVDGHNMRDLRHAFHRCGQLLPLELLALWANHVAQGLLPFHEKGIAHKDICDQNVMIGRFEGCAKILDFGMSGNRSQAEKGFLEGKPLYMPPDIVKAATDNASQSGKVKITPAQIAAGDVWALGALLYYLATDIHPYADRPADDEKNRGVRGYLFWKQLVTDRDTYRLLKAHEVCADIPEPLSEIIHSMLDPDWQKRPTIKQFESLIKTHYLFNGFMGTGVSMQSWRDMLAHLHPSQVVGSDGKKRARYTAADLAKDVRKHPELANLKQVLLGSYRGPFYDHHGITWSGDNGWARSFDVKRYPDIENADAQKQLYARLRNELPSAQRMVWPTGIDYSMRRCLRTVEGAIGPRCGDLLFDMFQRRLVDPTFAQHHAGIRQSLSAIDSGAKPYDIFRELAIDVLAKDHAPVKTKDGTDITRIYLKTKADRYLFDMYAQAIEMHPAKE